MWGYLVEDERLPPICYGFMAATFFCCPIVALAAFLGLGIDPFFAGVAFVALVFGVWSHESVEQREIEREERRWRRSPGVVLRPADDCQ